MSFPSKRLSLGSWLSLGNPYVAEIMARAGFEWLVIDMEHSAANSLAQAQQLIQVIDLSGCSPMVRVPENEPTVIKQVMDAGAHGVLVPMVRTVKEAQAAVDAIRYPPRGNRGVGLWRAQGYGRTFGEYCTWVNEEAVVILQIEHIDAIPRLRELLQVDGVSGFIVGPYDLSASLGIPGQFDHPSVLEALGEIDTVAGATGKRAGYHIVYPDREKLLRLVRAGYDFIAYGMDFTFLTSVVDGELASVRQALKHG